MRRLLYAAILCLPLYAQVSRIEIVAPSPRVVAGDSMTLTAAAFDNNGNTIPSSPFWNVDNSTVATIDSNGKLTGVSLGMVVVTAGVTNTIQKITLQVIPDHVSISPRSTDLLIGATTQFTATAFNKNGQPLPNIAFQWDVTSPNEDYTNQQTYGTVSASGMFTAVAEGTGYVRAMYNYSTYQPNGGYSAGLLQRIPIYASFSSSAPRPYQLKRLYNAGRQLRQNPKLTPHPSPLWQAPDGRILFNAVTDGVGIALLAWNGTSFAPVLTGGSPSASFGSMVNDLGHHSMAANGTLLTHQYATDGGLLQLGTADSLQPLVVSNTAAGNVENICCFNLTRNSLSSNGWFVFSANFRFPGATNFTQGVLRGVNGFVSEVLYSQNEVLPEFGVAGATSGNFGVDNNGVAWYLLDGPGKSVLYRHDANGRQKFLAPGDALLGSTIKFIWSGRGGSATPSLFFAEDGALIMTVQMSDNSNYLLRYTGTDPSHPDASLRLNNTPSTFGYQADGSVLFYANPYPNKGDGVWIWKGDTVVPVALIGKTLINGDPIQSVESGILQPDGQVVLMAGTTKNAMIVARFTGNPPQVLFQSGDGVTTQVPAVLTGFVPGARTGDPQFIAGGINNASVAQWQNGDIQPLLSLGDSILGSTAFTGINPYGNTQRAANGDLYALVSNTVIGRYADGQWSAALRFPFKLEDGATAYGTWKFALNNTGAIAWIGNNDKNDTRVYVTQDGQNLPVCAISNNYPAGTIDGKIVQSCDDFLLDDAGRVFLRLHFQGDPLQHLYVWKQGVLTPAVLTNRTTIGGQVINNVQVLRSSGMRTFASLQTALGSFIAEWTDSGWSVRFGPNDRMPTGVTLNSVFNYLEVNTAGDIAFITSSFGSLGLFFARGSNTATALTTDRRTADGDYLINILALDFRDDGTIYLLAVNQDDELVFYSATLKSQ